MLTVHGIETYNRSNYNNKNISVVATVLTVHGIETDFQFSYLLLSSLLQQCLPFTVLKLAESMIMPITAGVATVLTVHGIETVKGYVSRNFAVKVATVLTVHGIETSHTDGLCC